MTTMTKPFTDPYNPIPDSERIRLVSMIPAGDYLFIKSVRPQRGTMQICVNFFFKWLVYELKRNKTTDYSQHADLERFVLDRFAVGEGQPSLVSVSDADDKDDTRTTSGGSRPNQNVERQRSNTKGRVGKRGQGKRG